MSKRTQKHSRRHAKKTRRIRRHRGGGTIKNAFVKAIQETPHKTIEEFFSKESARFPDKEKRKFTTKNGKTFTHYYTGIRPITYVVELNGKEEIVDVAGD